MAAANGDLPEGQFSDGCGQLDRNRPGHPGPPRAPSGAAGPARSRGRPCEPPPQAPELPDDGIATLDRIRPLGEAVEEAVLGGLPDAKRAVLLEALRWISDTGRRSG
jgi:hypothetical protein